MNCHKMAKVFPANLNELLVTRHPKKKTRRGEHRVWRSESRLWLYLRNACGKPPESALRSRGEQGMAPPGD